MRLEGMDQFRKKKRSLDVCVVVIADSILFLTHFMHM